MGANSLYFPPTLILTCAYKFQVGGKRTTALPPVYAPGRKANKKKFDFELKELEAYPFPQLRLKNFQWGVHFSDF